MGHDNLNIDYTNLIIKDLSGEIDKGEKQMLEDWREENDANQKAYREIAGIWDKTGSVSSIAHLDIDKEWQYFQSRTSRKATNSAGSLPSRNIFQLAAGIALILTLSIVAYFYFNRFRVIEYNTLAETREVLLEDGTKITMNKFSRLTYKASYGETNRRVSLSGEAFFEVEKNRDLPFIVEAGEASIEVLGTSFNVKAYDEIPRVEVTVKSGMVSFKVDRAKKEKVILNPGEKVIFDKQEQEVEKKKSQDENFISWKTNRFVFDNTPLKDIVDLLNEVYGENIIIDKKELLNCPLTGTFAGKDLDNVLEVIKSALDLKIRREKGSIIIWDGKC
jgi:ferric-dicitrate binding protein FerR (iron transport regulator)